MVIIVEGTDAVGKTTQIQNIVNAAHTKGIVAHILHYSNVKAFGKDNEKIEEFSKKQYENIFKFIDYAADSDDIFIFDRCHLSECVYSKIYRNYSGDYVFNFEKAIANKNVKLILLIDTPENIIDRDKARGDGLSFSLDLETKYKEINEFLTAYEKSNLDKRVFSINGLSIPEVFTEINEFLKCI